MYFICTTYLDIKTNSVICLESRFVALVRSGAHSHLYAKRHVPEAFVSRNSVSYEVGTSWRNPRNQGSVPGKGKRFFLFSIAARQALESTQHSIQWVAGGGSFPKDKEAEA
jgi:hypothetical protein